MSDAIGSVDVARMELWVHYGQAYLVDDDDEMEIPEMLDDHPEHPVGIIRVERGAAFLITGLHTGTVDFTLVVADHDPGPDSEGYEDIVEVSFESPSGKVSLHEWGGEGVHEIPPLAAGPGWYRLRYHARGMDDAEDNVDTSDGPVERYLMQIWPQAPSDPCVVKVTSDSLRYWLTAG
ncbi:hypothetical protein [Microtetraspora malaysiensis]